MPGHVVIVEDDDDMRDSIACLLAAEGRSAAEYASAEAFLADGVPRGTSCILVDMRLGDGIDGITLIERLRRAGEVPPVVVITGHGDIPLAVRAMQAGAIDFIEKPFTPERLLDAVARASTRRSDDPAQGRARERVNALSPRERQVLKGLVAGQPNKVVAHELGLSTRTVETYRAAIMDKLGCRSFAEAVRLAITAGLDDETPPGKCAVPAV
ncbi:response regulator [Paracraurococcus ruber]|uniref:DNA-binding response regulator n=1 Tax=Paracraurococcus ruber TaxID=77675 RepID=A0ABS1D1Z6_9PROT|nr:response regulator [Paracraurococcus ruber]MBK1660855.1 hypothetical protein [Paracraurococcus ruber]TDG27037.1 response regulator [Paracraurococcus ruber]